MKFWLLCILYISIPWQLRGEPEAVQTARASYSKGREIILKESLDEVRGKSEKELISILLNASNENRIRIACGVLLLSELDSAEGRQSALTIFDLQIPLGIDEWESVGDWRNQYPVAYASTKHAELLPDIIEGGLSGKMEENAVVQALFEFNAAGTDSLAQVKKILETEADADRLAKAERLAAIMEGRRAGLNTPEQMAEIGKREKPISSPSLDTINANSAASTAVRSSSGHLVQRDHSGTSASGWTFPWFLGSAIILMLAAFGLFCYKKISRR